MKRMISIVLIAIVLCFSVCYADGEFTFEPTLTESFEYSATQWFDSSLNRAMLTWLLLLDYGLAVNDSSKNIDFAHDTYVAKDDTMLGVAGRCQNGKSILILYAPSGNFAMAQEFDGASNTVTEAALEKTFGSNYHMNSYSDMNTVAEIIGDALNG